MKQKKKMSDVLHKIEEAEHYKDWADVSDILDNSTQKDIKALIPMIPKLINHKSYLVRASVLDIIGTFHMRNFLSLVKVCLNDKNAIVRNYALMNYYDLLKEKALHVIGKFCNHKNVRNRVTALAIHYFEKNDDDSFLKLSKILKRKRCNPLNITGTINIFDYYYKSKPNSEIVQLYKSLLSDLPKSYWVVKQVRRMLKKWRMAH